MPRATPVPPRGRLEALAVVGFDRMARNLWLPCSCSPPSIKNDRRSRQPWLLGPNVPGMVLGASRAVQGPRDAVSERNLRCKARIIAEQVGPSVSEVELRREQEGDQPLASGQRIVGEETGVPVALAV